MSTIYNQEPQAHGLVTLKTTFGIIDVELFTKQCPKACRNFVQHCMDGFYKGTIFDRVEKDFIAVGGVPPIGVNDDYEPFPDEFHSRLRFTRRGLLATANLSKNDNGPKFFFTLGATPELQNKHTIFGRAKGNTVYSLVELNECHVDHNFRPESEQKILDVIVVENPFDDIKPRIRFAPPNKQYAESSSDASDDDEDKKPKVSAKKLKFGPNDESDDDDSEDSIAPSFAKKTDVEPGFTDTIKKESTTKSLTDASIRRDEDLEKNSTGEVDEKEKKLREIRAQIQRIKQQMENEPETKTLSERRKDQSDISADSVTSISDSYSQSVKRKDRARETLELVANFQKKLKQVAKPPTDEPKDRGIDSDYPELSDELALDLVDGDDWMKHKFEASDDTVLAKDANTKDKDWYSLDDPRKDRDYRSEKHHRDGSKTRSDSHRHSRSHGSRSK